MGLQNTAWSWARPHNVGVSFRVIDWLFEPKSLGK